MQKRLVAVAGPRKGVVVELGGEPVSLGRRSENDIVLPDLSVSREHCVVETDTDATWVRDCDSQNGVFVNGVPVRRKRLAHGDELTVGESLFLFVHDEPGRVAEPAAVEFEESDSWGQPTVQVPVSAGTSEEDVARFAAERPPDEAIRGLESLLVVCAQMQGDRDASELQLDMLQQISRIVPGERFALVAVDTNGESTTALASWRRDGDPKPIRVSRTIVRRAVNENAGLLFNDVGAVESLSAAESLRAQSVQSVLSVPLAGPAGIFGVLYLDTSDPTTPFDQSHLDVLTATGQLCAPAILRSIQLERLRQENSDLRELASAGQEIVGESKAMQRTYDFIEKVAPSEATVLVTGESGTGKELVARAIHRDSHRAGRPFVAINCAALNDTLLESELFGHEKGSFTGAIRQKRGRIEMANGGTLFLDEIGEMSPALQSKLLRVMQEREFERVGGLHRIRVDVRIIAATNRDLAQEIRQSRFREDLYYRLNVVSLRLPPLRERKDDIVLLARHFASIHAARMASRTPNYSEEAMSALRGYAWPGNVRELENAVEHAMVLGSRELVEIGDLPENVRDAAKGAAVEDDGFHGRVRTFKRELLMSAIEDAAGNFGEAARTLKVNRTYLHRLVTNMELRAEIDARTRPDAVGVEDEAASASH